MAGIVCENCTLNDVEREKQNCTRPGYEDFPEDFFNLDQRKKVKILK